jgi:pimeloyl-ACP methyl ester carboxylesterase
MKVHRVCNACIFLLLGFLFGCGSDQEEGQFYVLQGDDTLKTLAAQHYGDASKWPAIWLGTNTQALQYVELESLVDPERVGAGARVWIPNQREAASLLKLWGTPGSLVEVACWEATKAYGKVSCGYLVVPGDHAAPKAGPTIQVAIATVKSTAQNPAADPVFLLAGGPGVSGVLTLYADRILQFLETRDVVLIDQRGMGHSQPGLFCGDTESNAECRERLVTAGVNLSLFHTSAIADDLELLRQGLGLERINLFGFSYGTFLAQEILRRHPGSIRSAILDSCLPVSVSTTAEGGLGAVASFVNLVEDCAADATCNETCPDMEDAFYEILDRAAAEPFEVDVDGVTLSVGPSMLVTSVLMALNSPKQAPYVPAAIRALETEETASPALTVILSSNPDNREYLDCQGAKISVKCHDILPFETYDEAEQKSSSLNTHIADHYNLFARTGHQQCETWQVSSADASFHKPVESDVPTLILGGLYDTLTHAEWGETVAQSLSNAHYFAVPKTGHVTIQRDCPLSLVKAFLLDPSRVPDASCLSQMQEEAFFQIP